MLDPRHMGQRSQQSKTAAAGMGDTGNCPFPRVLHFSEHQMFRECLELRACETFPSGIPRSISTKLSSHTYNLRHSFIKYDDPMRQRLAPWGRCLQEYSRGYLTFPEKGQLVAISGLARRLGSGDE